jgi:hypothetical protein
MTNCRAISKFKQQKKARFEVKSRLSLAFFFEETDALKRQFEAWKPYKKKEEN